MFTHPSWAPNRVDSYERLEFLGDSVLELAIARALYDAYPDFAEGHLAKIRSHVVSRESCATVARELELGSRLPLHGSPPETDELDALMRNRNVLAALLEAAIAALFLEHGYEKIEDAIVAAFRGRTEYALTAHVDHKTELQELVAQQGGQVAYTIVATDGPPHDRSFTAAVRIDGAEQGVGHGRSKKQAEQQAAREALAHITGR